MSLRKALNRWWFHRAQHYEDRSLEWYVEKLARGERFSFSRFGDGEWTAIFGGAGSNCDGHAYTPELGAALRGALLYPKGCLYAIQKLTIRTMGRRVARFLKERGLHFTWYDSDVFHRANHAGALFPLIDQLRRMTVVLVGPSHLKAIRDTVVPLAGFVEVPAQNCFDHIDRLTEEIAADAAGRSQTVYALSASMAANVLVDRLYDRFGSEHWLLDLGSLWDGYAGVKSRGYFGKPEWTAAMARNLGTPGSQQQPAGRSCVSQ